MNEAETLPINLSAGVGGLSKKIGFRTACPQVLYLEYLLHFKCTLAGCNRQPSPLSPLWAVSDGEERIPVKEVQSCELAAVPHKKGKTQKKSIAFQKGNDIRYVTCCGVRKICSGFVHLHAVHFDKPFNQQWNKSMLLFCLNIYFTETQLCVMKRCIRWLLKCLHWDGLLMNFFRGGALEDCIVFQIEKDSVIICAWRLELAM